MNTAITIIKAEIARMLEEAKPYEFAGRPINFNYAGSNREVIKLTKALSVAVSNLEAFTKPEPFHKQSDMIYEANQALKSIAEILNNKQQQGE